MFSELFTDPIEQEMNFRDFHIFADNLIAWVDEDEKIDPDIARYMGMALLGIAERLEPTK